ncbi:MAG: protein kinase [Polyangiaceae bacterium]|nr:protein kinase [Polyangiaceae bacterium]
MQILGAGAGRVYPACHGLPGPLAMVAPPSSREPSAPPALPEAPDGLPNEPDSDGDEEPTPVFRPADFTRYGVARAADLPPAGGLPRAAGPAAASRSAPDPTSDERPTPELRGRAPGAPAGRRGPEARPHVEPPAAPNPGDADLEPGDVLAGRYRVKWALGHGGMGDVWLAHDDTLAIDVAIKVIRRDRVAEGSRERLLQEARAAARLGHPAIVRVFDFGESNAGDPFIVMERLRGEPLRALLDREGPQPPPRAVALLLPIASALAAAHAKGIVHRDLKPDNVLLALGDTGERLPKLMDFGVARLLGGEEDRRITQTGSVVGSPDYMSPEQARGEVDIDAAADIGAFTVMLSEIITGRRPFAGVNSHALMVAIMSADPDPIPGDPELWAILERGMAKAPQDRWPSMLDMSAALATWAMERGLEDDVAGTSLKTYRAAAMRRSAGALPEPAPAPAPAPPAATKVHSTQSTVVTRRPAAGSPPRWFWIGALAALLLGSAGLFLYAASGRGGASPTAPGTRAAAVDPPSAPAPPPPPPTASASASAASSQARPIPPRKPPPDISLSR